MTTHPLPTLGIRSAAWYDAIRVELFAPVLALVFLAKSPTSDPDHLAYLQFYSSTTLRSLGAPSDIEWGFRVLCAMGSAVGLSYAAFGYLAVLAALAIKFRVFRRLLGPAAVYAVLAYISSLFILHELVQIRLAIALALFGLGVEWWLDGRRVWAVISTAVATSMHVSIVALVVGLVVVRFPKVVLVGALVVIGFGLLPDDTRADLIVAAVRVVGTETPLVRKIAEYVFQRGQFGSTRPLITAQTVVVAATAVSVVLVQARSAMSLTVPVMARTVSLLLVTGLLSQVVLANSAVVSGRLFELFAVVMPIGQAITLHSAGRRWPPVVPVL
ncbi:MAG: EpsG family protein, partial [Candidatus Nanopelagicales bacterium]